MKPLATSAQIGGIGSPWKALCLVVCTAVFARTDQRTLNPMRSTDKEHAARVAAALALLNDGRGSAFAASLLSAQYGVSLRQARRYVNLAALELCNDLNPNELDQLATLSLHRLELIAGRAMDTGDDALAVTASKAHLSAVAQLRRAISAPMTKFRLSTAYTKPPPDPPF